MDRETAKRKVLRCLRLAASANPNEAAAALRQARALMAEYGLSELDALAAEVSSSAAVTRCQGANLTQSLSILVLTVAEQFRCRAIVNRLIGGVFAGRTTVHFYGTGSDAEIAAYAFVVLRRQMEADKAKYTRRIRKAVVKAARGEEFAQGWAMAVYRNMPRIEMSEERKAQIDAAVEAEHQGKLNQAKARDLTRKGVSSINDRMAGHAAGSKARVNPGVGGSSQRRIGVG